MTCKARSHACASDSPRLKRDTVHVAPLISASSPTTTTPHASSQSAKRRSSAVTKSWISTLVLGSLFTCRLSALASGSPADCPADLHKPATDRTPTGFYEAYEDGRSIWLGAQRRGASICKMGAGLRHRLARNVRCRPQGL